MTIRSRGFEILVDGVEMATHYGIPKDEMRQLCGDICAQLLTVIVAHTDSPRIALYAIANFYLNLSDACSTVPLDQAMKEGVKFIDKLASDYKIPNQKLREFFEAHYRKD